MPGLGPGYNGDGGPAVFAQLANPQRVLSTAGGGFLIADSDNQRVRSVSPAGIITTIAGDAVATYAGDSGAATDASIFEPVGGSPTTGGGLLIADVSDPAIREVTIPPTTTITLTPSSPNEANGWYIGTVHAKVSAGAGNTTNCDLDLPSAPTVFDELDSPCAFSGSGADITGNGVHLLWAASMNSFGDKETPVAFAIEIDNNPPSMRCVGRPSFVAGSRHKRVEATVADAVSGPPSPTRCRGHSAPLCPPARTPGASLRTRSRWWVRTTPGSQASCTATTPWWRGRSGRSPRSATRSRPRAPPPPSRDSW